ncbi:uncharacterized protein LOC141848355 [Curcuma longa]|uniref:uncharacterized protein LOC141848355 n=1 Tax=Curcuma longa TaxID=136217 RepID=UPI003D9EB4CD
MGNNWRSKEGRGYDIPIFIPYPSPGYRKNPFPRAAVFFLVDDNNPATNPATFLLPHPPRFFPLPHDRLSAARLSAAIALSAAPRIASLLRAPPRSPSLLRALLCCHDRPPYRDRPPCCASDRLSAAALRRDRRPCCARLSAAAIALPATIALPAAIALPCRALLRRLPSAVARDHHPLLPRTRSRSVASLRFVFDHKSRETVNRHFNLCLRAVLQLHNILLKKPEPVHDDCEEDRWKPFKGCLGALDGTFIQVTPPKEEKQRYRTRKDGIATNVLGVCCPKMQFIYVLPGWEGSAHDGRVLRDAISRPSGLKVPQGCYYLVDAGYCNSNGFLAPYRGHRYHLNEWEGRHPETAEEFFNMKHSRARNVIERCFGLLKGRWKILASPSFFPMQTQVRIIIACCLLHNLIRKFMSHDPLECILDEDE